MKYLIAIDGGSQSTKVEIFDLRGHKICRVSTPLPKPYEPKPGISEYPGDCLWDTLIIACREVLKAFPGKMEDILGVGVCSIRFCRVMMKEDFSLAYPVLNWMDKRVSLPHENSIPDVSYISSANGYLTARMTGQPKDTAANYQGVWPIDTAAWQWSKDPQKYIASGMPREKLMSLVMPGEMIGSVTKSASLALGLPEGLPVAATANDKAVEALGCGILDQNSLLISLGTYICAMTCGSEKQSDPRNYWINFASMPYHYLYESGGIRRGMWLVSWFEELMRAETKDALQKTGQKPEDYLCGLAQKVVAGCEGLMTVPEWLARTDKPFQRGIMIGFDARHKTGHIFRSILEAIALTMKNNTQNMLDELGLPCKEITISGGGSNSDLFMQIFADVFGIPALRCTCNGAASLGAAICAAVATGAYANFVSATEAMTSIEKRFLPNMENHLLYQKINEVYREIQRFTDPLLSLACDKGITI